MSNKCFDYKNFDNIGNKWIKYVGNFYRDQKEGYGVIYLTNKEYYKGKFKNNMIHGPGTFYTKNEEIAKGIWNCNHKIQ